MSETSEDQALRDPTKAYPKPPFEKQSQPWPGLAGKMTPPPDHGEKTYRGSGRLMGRKALITGGDSGMGRAAAIAYAREGADVAINYHPDEEDDAKDVIGLIRDAGRNAGHWTRGAPHNDQEKCGVKPGRSLQQAQGGCDFCDSGSGRALDQPSPICPPGPDLSSRGRFITS